MSGVAAGAWSASLKIDPTAFIAPGAVVVGTVSLGARSSVWFNTVVRGDTAPIEVGEGTNLQDNTVVHVDEGQPAVIGARVTVGHRTIVHGCVIEDECLIGMGSIVLSGARIGRGSLVGAGALVREGQIVPPGSLVVGAPARVVGPVAESHREAIQRGAEHYAELAASYAARGFARPRPPRAHPTGITSLERGPMSFLEWGQLLAVLAESPDFAAGLLERHGEAPWRRAPGPKRWSAHEVVCHLCDADREVLEPRTERILAEDCPQFLYVDMTGWDVARGYREQPTAAALAEWRDVRRGILGRLAPLGRADWARPAVHSANGPVTLADLVRYFAEHDLSHRRQLAAALAERS